MKVYLCKEAYYDGCEFWKTVMKVVDCEVKAIVWQEDPEFKSTDSEWREVEEFEVE